MWICKSSSLLMRSSLGNSWRTRWIARKMKVDECQAKEGGILRQRDKVLTNAMVKTSSRMTRLLSQKIGLAIRPGLVHDELRGPQCLRE